MKDIRRHADRRVRARHVKRKASIDAMRAQAITQCIKPLLADHGGSVQGAVLAELTSIWLAGHAPQIRELILTEHIKCIRDLIPISEYEVFGEAGHPAKEEKRK